MTDGGRHFDTAATFLASTLGGGAIALILWFLLKEPCGRLITGAERECVKIGGTTAYEPGGLLLIGGLLGLGIGFLIWAIRQRGQ